MFRRAFLGRDVISRHRIFVWLPFSHRNRDFVRFSDLALNFANKHHRCVFFPRESFYPLIRSQIRLRIRIHAESNSLCRRLILIFRLHPDRTRCLANYLVRSTCNYFLQRPRASKLLFLSHDLITDLTVSRHLARFFTLIATTYGGRDRRVRNRCVAAALRKRFRIFSFIAATTTPRLTSRNLCVPDCDP